MTERATPAPAATGTPAPAAKSANKDLAAQISGSQTRMIHLERDDLTDDTAAELAKGDPPLQAVFDQVRQLWAVTLAPTP